MTWNAASGATSYKVIRATATTQSFTLATVTSLSYIDTTASNGTTYYYVVRAVNAAGEGPSSNQVNATPPTPSAPTNLVATPGNARVSLAWDAVTGATSYEILRATLTTQSQGNRIRN